MKKLFVLLVLFLVPIQTYASFSSISGIDLFSSKKVTYQMSDSKLGTVILFMSANCPCSGSHESLIREMAKEYSNFIFLVVHSNANEDIVKTQKHFFAAKLGVNIIQDET